MSKPKVTARGVYLDLEVSPYEYKSPYGDIFKFPSQKKLDIYTRDLPRELGRVDKLLEKHQLKDALPDDFVSLLYREMSRAFYRNVVR